MVIGGWNGGGYQQGGGGHQQGGGGHQQGGGGHHSGGGGFAAHNVQHRYQDDDFAGPYNQQSQPGNQRNQVWMRAD